MEDKDEDYDSLFEVHTNESTNLEEKLATQGFEKDLDLDQMNFNLIKNSKAFKNNKNIKQSFLEVLDNDEAQSGMSGLYDPVKRSEDDYSSLMFSQ